VHPYYDLGFLAAANLITRPPCTLTIYLTLRHISALPCTTLPVADSCACCHGDSRHLSRVSRCVITCDALLLTLWGVRRVDAPHIYLPYRNRYPDISPGHFPHVYVSWMLIRCTVRRLWKLSWIQFVFKQWSTFISSNFHLNQERVSSNVRVG